jgi:hypothetical protein
MIGIGGAKRDRTVDLLVANEALSQLSYSPTKAGDTPFSLAAQAGFEKSRRGKKAVSQLSANINGRRSFD